MPKIKKDFSPQDLEACLLTLGGDETEAQKARLRDLCPCRSRCYDKEVWLAICHAFYSPQKEVQHQAEHAIETLLERSKTDKRSTELRDWLLEKNAFELSMGRLEKPRKKSRESQKQEEKVTSFDLPGLLDILEGDKVEDKQKALELLCPCRNVHYNQEVWRAIFQMAESADGDHIRHQAQHAIGTLRERAVTDPRSQELLLRLVEDGVDIPDLGNIIPVWDPLGRAGLNGLYIPRFQAHARSKKNRGRR